MENITKLDAFPKIKVYHTGKGKQYYAVLHYSSNDFLPCSVYQNVHAFCPTQETIENIISINKAKFGLPHMVNIVHGRRRNPLHWAFIVVPLFIIGVLISILFGDIQLSFSLNSILLVTLFVSLFFWLRSFYIKYSRGVEVDDALNPFVKTTGISNDEYRKGAEDERNFIFLRDYKQ